MVASFGNFQVGVVGWGAQNPPVKQFRPLFRPQVIKYLFHGIGSEPGVHFGYFAAQILLVALREAAEDNQLADFPALFPFYAIQDDFN